MAIETKIEGNKLIIICDLEKPTPSASGKTLVVASTRGNMKTSLTVNGKPLTIGLNAYIPKQIDLPFFQLQAIVKREPEKIVLRWVKFALNNFLLNTPEP